jgi:uncharacterized damage-inducible protein DinB
MTLIERSCFPDDVRSVRVIKRRGKLYRHVEDFLRAYEFQVEGTSRIFAKLTDQNLGQRVTEGHRTLGQMAWHIVTSVAEMMSRTGLEMSSVSLKAPPPTSAAAIAEGYRKVTRELVSGLQDSWNDQTLLQTDEMYGQTWSRGLTLSVLMNHEIHHRGQMTVLLRQASEQVPGIFGPAKEEWDQYGMEPPPY